MPTPKKRTSKSKRGMRRSHDGLTVPAYSECPECHEIKRPHLVCPNCGYYRENEVIEVEAI